MKTSILLALTSACSLLTFAQTPPVSKKAAPTVAPAKKAAAPAAKKTAEPPPPPRPDGLYVTLDITHGGKPVGKIVGKFYEKESPVTVRNFVDLAMGKKAWLNPKTNKKAMAPLYNGLTFHRMIPGFMIQGGDPMGNGTGGTDSIVDEYNPSLTFDKPGVFAMANTGAPRTGSCQFFITDGTPAHLNGRHPIFAQVIEGQDLVASLARVPRGQADRPSEPVVMQKVTITRYPLGQPIWPVAVPVKAAPKTGAPKTGAPKTAVPVAPKKTA